MGYAANTSGVTISTVPATASAGIFIVFVDFFVDDLPLFLPDFDEPLLSPVDFESSAVNVPDCGPVIASPSPVVGEDRSSSPKRHARRSQHKTKAKNKRERKKEKKEKRILSGEGFHTLSGEKFSIEGIAIVRSGKRQCQKREECRHCNVKAPHCCENDVAQTAVLGWATGR